MVLTSHPLVELHVSHHRGLLDPLAYDALGPSSTLCRLDGRTTGRAARLVAVQQQTLAHGENGTTGRDGRGKANDDTRSMCAAAAAAAAGEVGVGEAIHSNTQQLLLLLLLSILRLVQSVSSQLTSHC